MHLCHLSRSLDREILHINLCWKFLLHPYVMFSSSVGFHIQSCIKGWYLHRYRWSSRSSCNCLCYPMGSFWARTNPSMHMWLSYWYALILIWRSVFGQWSMYRHHILPLFERIHEPCFVFLDVGIFCMLDLVDPHGRNNGIPFRSWNCILDIMINSYSFITVSFHFFLVASS